METLVRFDLMNCDEMDNFLTAAFTEKGKLVDLINIFVPDMNQQSKIRDIVIKPSWNSDVNKSYWNNFFDGDFDNLGSTIVECNQYLVLQ